MIKIFATEKIKELDQYTITNEPISSIDFVERAAIMFVQEFVHRYNKQHHVIIFSGPGNNGADALAIARMLVEDDYSVETYLINPSNHLSADCAINRDRLLTLSKVVFTEEIDDFVMPELTAHDIIIDGLFGSGLNRPLEKGYAAIAKCFNESESEVVAIDIPSGLFGEDNRSNKMDCVVKADLTLTFGFPKLAFLFPENEPYVGEWKVLDIGNHPDIVEKTNTNYLLVGESDVADVFFPRDRFAHKGIFGHALLIAGSRCKMGAAVMSARACLRSGAGLLTVHVPQCGEQILQTAFPEAMLSLDKNNEFFSIIPNLSSYTAVGVGPGIGQHLETGTALERLLETVGKPVVLDADALNLIAANKTLLDLIPKRSILTPHPKEFDRLTKEHNDSYERLYDASQFAVKYQVTVVLKGAYTAVCVPTGKVLFNNCGNPGMATAGSGDVLTGVLLGLLAQGYEPETAAIAGVFIHATAGDLAASFHSEESMIASDIISMLGKVFKQFK